MDIYIKDLIGRHIKALVDYPDGGDVKKNEIGKIRIPMNGDLRMDFKNQKNYIIDNCLDTTLHEYYY